ncbi:MAG: SRPBCC family protein [Chloroflexota bacterium]
MTTETQTNLHITRLLNAPRDCVWRAWTDPKELATWWWPAKLRTTYDLHLHEGGTYRFRTAELEDRSVTELTGHFLEVREPERLVYTWRWTGVDGEETRVTVIFDDRGDQTEVRLTHEPFAEPEDRANHVVGWNSCIDRLEQKVNAEALRTAATGG